MTAEAMYPEIADLMGSSVTVESEATTDGFGKRTFTARAGSPYACYPAYTDTRVWSMEGREETTTVTLYVNSQDLVATDRFTYEGRQYKCLSIETWRNENNQVVGQVVYLQ